MAKKRAYRMTARRASVDESRERILRGTYELWLERPYDELTMEAVAERAGVTRQTVIRQFGSKDDLIVATAAWHAPSDEERRDVEPGDVGAAVDRLMDGYELMGDANVRMLQVEERIETIAMLLGRARASHRAWLERTFEPYLPPKRRRRERERAVLLLYAATDVMTWKLLRRDLGQSREEVRALLEELLRAALARVGPVGREGER